MNYKNVYYNKKVTGNKIRKLREKNYISQPELAPNLGIDTHLLNEIEEGNKDLNMISYVRLIKYFRLTPEEAIEIILTTNKEK